MVNTLLVLVVDLLDAEEMVSVALASKSSRSQSDQASVRCAGTKSLIHGDSTTQRTEFKESAGNALVPDTTGHLQMSPRVHCRWS